MIRLLVDPPQGGAHNMAVDEALMGTARAGGGFALRFYQWEPACLSFGRNQTARGAYDAEAAAHRGVDVVRRPTGGRAVFHHRELTYAVAAPVAAWGSLRETYRRINRALVFGLRELGAAVTCSGERAPSAAARAPRPGPRACFRDPLPGEVMADGRKLVGSAQWRDGGALLQHGSLLLVDEQAEVEQLRMQRIAAGPSHAPRTVPSATIGRATGAIALDELLAAEPPIPEIVEALRRGFSREFAVPVEPSELTASEVSTVAALRDRYSDPAWTWRR